MKKMQTQILKIILILIIISSFSISTLSAQDSQSKLRKADSLFSAKLYTQSFDLYKDLFNNKVYSNAMLLKMAFIQEGLGHLSQSLYYLNLYDKFTHDSQASEKIKELASKNSLEGFDDPYSQEKITQLLGENRLIIISFLTGTILVLFFLMIFQKIKSQRISFALPILTLGFLAVLVWQINFCNPNPNGIIESPNTYIMEGPSAGSQVLAIVGEGHKLVIDGKYDVWLKIKWNGKEAFVKESSLLQLNLN